MVRDTLLLIISQFDLLKILCSAVSSIDIFGSPKKFSRANLLNDLNYLKGSFFP